MKKKLNPFNKDLFSVNIMTTTNSSKTLISDEAPGDIILYGVRSKRSVDLVAL